MRTSSRFLAVLAAAVVVVPLAVATGSPSAAAAQDEPAAVQPLPVPDTVWEPSEEAGEVPTELNVPEEPWTPPSDVEVPPAARGAVPEAELMTLGSSPSGAEIGAPGVGELPWFSFQDFDVAPDTSAQVNIANGNLLVKANDFAIAVPGYALRHDRFYNALLDVPGSQGGGWHSSNGAFDIGIVLDGPNVIFYGPNGLVLRFVRLGSTNEFTSPDGSNMTLEQQPGGGSFSYVLTQNKTGDQLKFGGFGWLTASVDRNGVGETYAYSAGNIVQSFHDNGRSLLFDWSASGSLERVRDGVGRAVEYTYDSDDRLETVTSADGKVTTYAYDSVGRLSSMSVPSASSPSTTVSFAYDPSDRVTTVTQQPGIETSFAYSDGETVVTDPNGNAATYEIDSSGRVTSTEDALGRSRSQEWTANSDIASSTDAIGTNTTIYTYDGSNNRTSAELPTGAAASAVYAVGTDCAAPDTGTAFQAKCSTDDAGNEKQYEYDAAGNQTKQTDTTGSTPGVEFERTYGECSGSHGQICTATDGNGNTTTYAYNADGNLTTVTPPGPLGATTYTHDSLGRVTSVTDGNGDTTGYQYDVRDRIVLTTFENGQNLVTAYYPNGLEESRTDSAGGTVAFEYDHQGRITSQTGPGSGISQTYQYDNVGNMTSHADAGGSTYYGYDDANQLIRLSESGSICMPGDTTLPSTRCIKFQYDDNALEIARRFPGGSTFTERDDSGRPTRITARVGGTDVVDIGYSYTQDGEDRTLVQTRTSHAEEGIAAGAVTTYTYDSRERLILAEEKDGSAVSALWAYAYDDNSNRTQQIRSGDTGAAAGTIDYAYNAANQITSATGQTTTWTYDAAGNQTRNGLTGDTTTYGDRGEATTFGTTNADYFATGNTDRLQFGGVSFTNSALGTMQRTEGATTDNYTRTPDGEIIGTRNSPDRYYIKDHLGSVVGMISDDGTYYGGYSYSPYGETRAVGTDSTVIANPIRYIGEHHDGDGIYKLGARYYDTSLGRFTQMDPSGQEANPYAYAGCNPINAVDSTGLSTTFWPCAGALLGVVGSVALLAAEIAAFVALAVVPDVTITKAGAVIIGLTLGGTATLAASAAINAFVTCG